MIRYHPTTMTWKPWTFFMVAIAGWMNRRQQDAISYLKRAALTLEAHVKRLTRTKKLQFIQGNPDGASMHSVPVTACSRLEGWR